MFKKLFVTFIILLTLIGIGFAQENELEVFQEQLGVELETLLPQYHVPGVAIALVQDKQLSWSQGYGLADVENERPVTPDTPFQVASIGKSLTAWAIMGLVEQGLIDLDAPVSDYITRWSFPESRFDPQTVTVRGLLTHTAGLNIEGYRGFSLDEELPDLLTLLNGADKPRVLQVRILWEPNTQFHYSGGGYTVLQLLIEEVTGQSFTDYMQETIFDPLGMNNSSFVLTEAIDEKAALPYDNNMSLLERVQFTSEAASGLYTSANDLAQFVAANAGNDTVKLLNPESIQAIQTPNEIANGQYGFGVFIYPLESGLTLVGHDGFNEGWRAIWLASPETGDGIVVLTNGNGGIPIFDKISCLWSEWALGEEPDFC